MVSPGCTSGQQGLLASKTTFGQLIGILQCSLWPAKQGSQHILTIELNVYQTCKHTRNKELAGSVEAQVCQSIVVCALSGATCRERLGAVARGVPFCKAWQKGSPLSYSS